MASSKAALKAAKAALDKHQYQEAANEARKVLESDQKNYFASAGLFCLVFRLLLTLEW
jgi:hypothetical protein